MAAENHHAVWIPCAGHSLNLVGHAAAECFEAAVELFFLPLTIYVFFTVSTHHYEILTGLLKTGIWSYISAKEGFYNMMVLSMQYSKTFIQGYHPIHEALLKIPRHENEMSKACSEANGLHGRMSKQIYAGFFLA